MLSKLLEDIHTIKDENLLVGYDKSDDAAVYKISDDLAIVQTVDFFPPIVDDPFMFGQIAACNAISDIYAMGATPKLGLNVMCITKTMDKEVVHEILHGGYEKAKEANMVIAGGHTINAPEPKYGLSVTGFVNPHKILANSTSSEGDVIILTKALGVGILTTAGKAGLANKEVLKKVEDQMATLNKYACEKMLKYDVHSCTDVTGFALIGHGYEMAKGSNLQMNIDSSKIPYFKEAVDFAKMGLVPEGAYRNRDYAEKYCIFENVEISMQDILFDPQTSGGLLISVNEKDANKLINDLKNTIEYAEIIGFMSKIENVDKYIKIK